MVKIKKGQVVYLTWLDSALKGAGWVYEADGQLDASAKEIETVGFVLDVSAKAVLLANSKSPSGGVVAPLAIPLGCITNCKQLEIR